MSPDVIDIPLKDLESSHLLELLQHPEPEKFQLILNAKRKRFHIGAIALLPDHALNKEIYLPSRQMAVRNLLASHYAAYKTNDREIITIERAFREEMFFVSWANEHQLWDIFSEKDTAITAILGYTNHLKSQETSGKIGSKTAARRQNAAIEVIANATDWEINFQGLHQFSSANNSKSTSLPDEENLARTLAISHAAFNRLADFILNFEKYPFIIEIASGKSWVFPAKRWIMPPQIQKIRESLSQKAWTWDYETGEVSSNKYIAEKYGLTQSDAKKMRARSLRIIERANSDARHHSRLNLAVFATRAFLFLFDSMVEANRSFYSEHSWDDNYFISKPYLKDGVEFVDVKPRARSFVKFTITAVFLDSFLKYLKLRRYLINGRPFDKLFLQLEKDHTPTAINPSSHQIYFEQILNLVDRNIKPISNRQLRANKGDHLQNHSSPEITAGLLQNETKTAQRHYSEGSESRQSIEMTEYFNYLNSKIRDEEHRLRNEVKKIAVGSCSAYKEPIATEHSIVNPDCTDYEGCLGCKNFLLHSDREDIHKLLSMKYVLNQILPLVFKSKKAASELSLSISRIDLIISRIASLSHDLKLLVEDVSILVDSGNLTDYWEWKLNQLFKLGVIN